MQEFIIGSLIMVAIYIAWEVYLYVKNKPTPQQLAQQQQSSQPVNPQTLDYNTLQAMSLNELHTYNGISSPKVYVGIKNIVFDVSASDAYKPDGSYPVFAGQDASVALGKLDLSGKYLNEYGITKQPDDEIQNMEGWFSYFYQRYPVVARIGKPEDKKNQ